MTAKACLLASVMALCFWGCGSDVETSGRASSAGPRAMNVAPATRPFSQIVKHGLTSITEADFAEIQKAVNGYHATVFPPAGKVPSAAVDPAKEWYSPAIREIYVEDSRRVTAYTSFGDTLVGYGSIVELKTMDGRWVLISVRAWAK